MYLLNNNAFNKPIITLLHAILLYLRSMIIDRYGNVGAVARLTVRYKMVTCYEFCFHFKWFYSSYCFIYL